MMSARRFLNLIYGMCADRMDSDQLAELDAALTLDVDDIRQKRNDDAVAVILAAGGELG